MNRVSPRQSLSLKVAGQNEDSPSRHDTAERERWSSSSSGNQLNN